MGEGVGLRVGVAEGVGVGVGDVDGDSETAAEGVMEVEMEGEALVVAEGFAVGLTATPLFHTNFFPDFMQVNLLP
mgnify:CR=1 FL=1